MTEHPLRQNNFLFKHHRNKSSRTMTDRDWTQLSYNPYFGPNRNKLELTNRRNSTIQTELINLKNPNWRRTHAGSSSTSPSLYNMNHSSLWRWYRRLLDIHITHRTNWICVGMLTCALKTINSRLHHVHIAQLNRACACILIINPSNMHSAFSGFIWWMYNWQEEWSPTHRPGNVGHVSACTPP